MALADRYGHRVGSDAVVDKCRRLELAVRRADGDEVAGTDAQSLGDFGVHLDPGVPDDLGDRVG